MFYQEKSAFTKNLIKRQLKQNDKNKNNFNYSLLLITQALMEIFI